MQRYVAVDSAALAISLTIARNAQRSAAVVETALNSMEILGFIELLFAEQKTQLFQRFLFVATT